MPIIEVGELLAEMKTEARFLFSQIGKQVRNALDQLYTRAGLDDSN
jgi:hypothetical protein